MNGNPDSDSEDHDQTHFFRPAQLKAVGDCLQHCGVPAFEIILTRSSHSPIGMCANWSQGRHEIVLELNIEQLNVVLIQQPGVLNGRDIW